MPVFGGILKYPSHRLADMHGLIRAVVRTRTRLQVTSILASHGIELPPSVWILGIWCESKSVTEEHVTQGHSGKVFVCNLPEMYIKAERYEPLSSTLQKK
jgi:hypothetical protein